MFKSGYTALSSGVTGVTIPYGATFAGPPASVVANIAYTGATGHLILSPALYTKTSTYCIFEFNGATDSADYVINWQASDANGQDTTVGSKPVNRLEAASSVSANDYVPVYSTSGGASVTQRASMNLIRSFVYSINGITAPPAGVSTFNSATGDVEGVDSFNGATGAITGVSSFNSAVGDITGVNSFNGLTGAVTGVGSVNGATGAVTVVSSFNGSTGTVTGVGSFNGSTGAVTGVGSFNGSTGAVTGVSSVNGATGAVTVVSSYNGSTGAVTGVSSFNGSTGAVTGVSSVNGGTGAVTVVSSFNGNTGAVTGVGTFNGATGTVIGVNSVNGATGVVTFEFVSSFNGGTGAVTGVSSVNGSTGAVTVVSSFNGLTGAVTGVGSFNGSTGDVTGVGSFNGATGAVTGVSSFNGNTGAVIGVSSVNGDTGAVSVAGLIVRGSGNLRGYTSDTAAAESPATLVIEDTGVDQAFEFTITTETQSQAFYVDTSDPGAPPRPIGSIFINSGAWGSSTDVSNGLASAISGAGMTNVTASGGWGGGGECHVENAGTGAAASLGATSSAFSGTITGGGSGVNLVPASGNTSEVELIAQSGTKKLKPLAAGIYSGATGLGDVSQLALKVSGVYYPIGSNFATGTTGGNVAVNSYFAEWVAGRASASLVARFPTTPVDGSTATFWAVAEQTN